MDRKTENKKGWLSVLASRSGFVIFSLLLVAIFAIWIATGQIRESRIRSKWEQRNGLVTQYENGQVLELSFEPRSPQDVIHILEIRDEVKHLILVGNQVTDDALIELQHLTAIEDLELLETSIKGPGLTYLQPLDTLSFLEIEMPLGDDTDIPSVDFSARLFRLEIKGTHATDKGIQNLENLANSISTLDLSDSEITDQGLLNLEAWNRRIEKLDLSNTSITDEGLKNIQDLSAGIFLLKSLDVSGTKITDAGIPFLAAHQGIQEIDLFNTKITPSGLEELERLLPKATILGVSSQ